MTIFNYNAMLQADGKSSGICVGGPENANKIADVTNAVARLLDKLPHTEALGMLIFGFYEYCQKLEGM